MRILRPVVLAIERAAAERRRSRPGDDLRICPATRRSSSRTRKARSRMPAGSTSGRSTPAGSRPACTSWRWTRFWYIDPDYGIDGVWDNSLAAEKPIYNDDFTEMTVKLRQGIFWSDGVEFTADDVRLHGRDPHRTPTACSGARRSRSTSSSVTAPDPLYGGLQAEEAELALPRAVHRALERDLDDAEARLREGGGPAAVRLQPAGLARRLHAAQLRPERQVVHLAASARTGSAPRSPASASRARNTSPISIPARPTSASSRSSTTSSTSSTTSRPRACSRWRKQFGELARLVRGLPLRPSRPDAAGGDLQHPARQVPGPRRALGAGAADRHQGGVDGLLSRRRDDLGDRHPADRHPPGLLPQADARTGSPGFEIDTGKRKIKPYDPTDRPADRRHAAPVDGRADPDRSGGDRQGLRARLVEARSRGRGGAAREGRLHASAAISGSRRTASRSRSRSWSRARRGRS